MCVCACTCINPCTVYAKCASPAAARHLFCCNTLTKLPPEGSRWSYCVIKTRWNRLTQPFPRVYIKQALFGKGFNYGEPQYSRGCLAVQVSPNILNSFSYGDASGIFLQVRTYRSTRRVCTWHLHRRTSSLWMMYQNSCLAGAIFDARLSRCLNFGISAALLYALHFLAGVEFDYGR